MTDFGLTPVDPADLLAILEKRIATRAGLASADHCFLSLVPDRALLRSPPADRFVSLFPGRWPVWGGPVAGGGMNLADPDPDHEPTDAERLLGLSAFGFDAQLVVTVFCRVASDQEFKATRKIREASVGVVAVALRVLAALQFPHFEDKDEHALTREPPRAEALNWDTHEVDDVSWATVKIPYSLRFTCKLPR